MKTASKLLILEMKTALNVGIKAPTLVNHKQKGFANSSSCPALCVFSKMKSNLQCCSSKETQQ